LFGLSVSLSQLSDLNLLKTTSLDEELPANSYIVFLSLVESVIHMEASHLFRSSSLKLFENVAEKRSIHAFP
jgi:hypothetical protein